MESMISTNSVAESLTELVNKSKKRKVEKVARSCVKELTVPIRPLCVGTASLEETTIFVCTPPATKKQGVLHLRVDCISWLLSYAADELACQGVSRGDTCSDTTERSQIIQVSMTYTWNGTSNLKGGKPSLSQGTRKGMCYTLGRMMSHPRC